MSDDALRPYFEGVDLDRLRQHQTDFLLTALQVGRPRHVDDAAMGALLERTHRGLDVDDAAYDRVVAHLLTALERVGFCEIEVDRAAARLAGLRQHVVRR